MLLKSHLSLSPYNLCKHLSCGTLKYQKLVSFYFFEPFVPVIPCSPCSKLIIPWQKQFQRLSLHVECKLQPLLCRFWWASIFSLPFLLASIVYRWVHPHRQWYVSKICLMVYFNPSKSIVVCVVATYQKGLSARLFQEKKQAVFSDPSIS